MNKLKTTKKDKEFWEKKGVIKTKRVDNLQNHETYKGLNSTQKNEDSNKIVEESNEYDGDSTEEEKVEYVYPKLMRNRKVDWN